MATMTTKSAVPTRRFPQFALSHSIDSPPLIYRGQLRRLLVGAEKHVQRRHVDDDGGDKTDGMKLPMDRRADLIDGQRNDISQKALITNGERRPTSAVHLTPDGGHGRETRRAEQIERKEGIARPTVESKREIGSGARRRAVLIENAQRADDVLLRD